MTAFGATPTPGSRGAIVDRLATGRFDVLVVGGGIVGSGVAALAAQHGLSVALVERLDFASGTSSASTKLIHGGLRYLRMGHLGLVREALRERELLADVIAPHLVRHLSFVLPVYRSGPYRTSSIRAAMWAYSALELPVPRMGRVVGPAHACRLVPPLSGDGLRGAGLYRDGQTNDARLCLANVRAAADAGAVVLNRAEVTGVERRGAWTAIDVVDALAGVRLTVTARTVVNAAGPAVDRIRRLEDPRAGTSVMLSKGAHVVLEQPAGWRTSALAIPLDQTRVSFAIPWEGLLLLGTTDEPFSEGDSLEVTAREEKQILEEAATALPPEALRCDTIRYRFAGLRVLPAGEGATAAVRREVTLSRGRHGVISVAGGKLTTYRRIAIDVLDALRPELALHRLDKRPRALPGAASPAAAAAALRRTHADVEPPLLMHLTNMYGTLAREVLAYRLSRDDALEPVIEGASDVVAQVLHARDSEWAVDVQDVARRRTTLAIRGLDSPALRQRLLDLLEGTPAKADGMRPVEPTRA